MTQSIAVSILETRLPTLQEIDRTGSNALVTFTNGYSVEIKKRYDKFDALVMYTEGGYPVVTTMGMHMTRLEEGELLDRLLTIGNF